VTIEPGWAWLAAAVLLAGAELAVPGVFLVWLALAAAVAGAAGLLGLAVPGQLAIFALSAVASIYAGRAVYRHHAMPADPLLNDGAARLIGRRVTITRAIVDGEGRASLGDGAWTVHGSDMAEGTRAVVVDVDGNALTVVAARP